VDRKAKSRSDKKPRNKIPVEIAARAVIHDTGERYALYPIYLCMACSSFFLYSEKKLERVIETMPNFCPNCGRERARKSEEDSHDG